MDQASSEGSSGGSRLLFIRVDDPLRFYQDFFGSPPEDLEAEFLLFVSANGEPPKYADLDSASVLAKGVSSGNDEENSNNPKAREFAPVPLPSLSLPLRMYPVARREVAGPKRETNVQPRTKQPLATHSIAVRKRPLAKITRRGEKWRDCETGQCGYPSSGKNGEGLALYVV